MIKLQEYGKYVLLNGRNKGRGVVLRTLVLMSCILLGSLLHAQNNPYGIKDQLYPLYNNAYNKRTTDEGLVLAKQLYDDAVRLNDGKAQCLALSIPMLYYFYEDDKEGEFLKAVKSMQDKALATGYRQYYYFGITNTVTYFLSKNRHFEVYKYVLELEAEARSKNDMLGLFYGLTCLSQVYTAFLEFGSSNKMLEEALNVGNTYLQNQDMATVYRKMCDNYNFMFDYKRMEETAVRMSSVQACMAAPSPAFTAVSSWPTVVESPCASATSAWAEPTRLVPPAASAMASATSMLSTATSAACPRWGLRAAASPLASPTDTPAALSAPAPCAKC